MINVLLTCAGRRNYLVRFFREALAGRGQILACDSVVSAPALQAADRAFLMPQINHPDYIDIMLAICQEYHVRLLFSLNDLELPLIARHKEKFLKFGTLAVVPTPMTINLIYDKWSFYRFLQEVGIQTPLTFTSLEETKAALSRRELTFPLVVKPRWGEASLNIEYPESVEELALTWEFSNLNQQRLLSTSNISDNKNCLIAQQKIFGEEYSLDIVNDLDGRYMTTFVKRKLAIRGGLTDKAVTEDQPEVKAIGRRIGEAIRHIGNLDCDVLVDGEHIWVLELNPGFGGCYHFSHNAGANLPAALIAWAQGEIVDPKWLMVKPDITAAKCDYLLKIETDKISQERLGILPCNKYFSSEKSTTVKVLIIGAGGHARVVADALLCNNRFDGNYEVVGFLDDNEDLHEREQSGIRIIGNISELDKFKHDAVVLGIGNNLIRQRLYLELKKRGENIITAIHPRAILAPNVIVGDGTVIFAGVVINSGAHIGSNVILNTSCTVGHDLIIDSHAQIGPGVNLGGGVKIGEGAFIGMRSAIIQNKTIGNWAVVGAGAVVIRDVVPNEMVVGVPAVPIQKRSMQKYKRKKRK